MRTQHHFVRFLILLLALVSPLALHALDHEPFTLPVGFSFRISGVGNGIMTIYGEGGSPSIGHSTYNANTESDDSGMASLSPGRSYTMNFQASGPTNYALSLVAPSGYQAFINGLPKDYLDVTTAGGGYSHNYTIQIRPALGEAVLDNGTFTGIDLGQAVSWELGMGTARGGHGIGRVGFREFDLSNSPASRYRLFYTPPLNSDQINIIWDGINRIRQIASPHKVMDFVDVTNGYEVRYYAFDDTTWTGSIYTINSGATPWKVIKVESAATNQLTITETEGSVSRVSQLNLTSGSISSGTYTWQLQEGGPSSNWLRTTTHASTKSGGTRENVVTVRAGGTTGTIITENKYAYTTLTGLGETLYQEIANPNGGSASVTTTYAYYETAPGSGSETHRGHFGRVKSIVSSTGSWTAIDYYDTWNSRGQVKYRYQPYQDSPSSVTFDAAQGRVTYHTYDLDASGRVRRPLLVQEEINDVETSKTSWIYDNSEFGTKVKATVRSYRDGSTYQSTYSESVDPLTAVINLSNEPLVVKNPDGSQVSWSRSAGDFSYSPNYTFTVNTSTGQHWRVLRINGASASGNGAETSTQSSYNGQSFAPIYLVPYKSTMEVTVLRFTGRPLRTETRIYTGSGNWSAAINTVDTTYNAAGRIATETTSNGAVTTYTYANGRVSSLVTGDNTETQYTYDALGRTETVTKVGASASGIHAAQANVITTYDYDEPDSGNYGTKETVSAVGTSETIVSTKSFDRAGRVVKITPPGLSATTISYTPSSRIQTTIAPDGGTTIQESYRDGRPKSTTGTAVVPQYFSYAVETDGRQRVQVNTGTSNSTRLQKTWTDWLGRPIKLEKPGFSQSGGQSPYVEEQVYDGTTGQLTKTTRTGSAPTRYEYNALGQVKRSGLDVNDDGLVTASNDRITDSDTVFELISTAWWQKSTSTTYPDSGAATHPIITVSRQRLSGFGSGIRGETQSTDAEGNTVTSVTSISGKLVTTQTTVPAHTTDSYAYSYNGRSSASTGHDGLTTKIEYDPLGRQWKTTDARSLVTTQAYYTGTGLPHTVTDSASNVVSTTGYTTAGRTAWTQDALGQYTRFAYNPRGQLTHQWGGGTYPVSYGYDATYGDRTGMTTYRSAPAADSTDWPSVGAGDTTTWVFDTPSGLLWKKTDASDQSVVMNYNQAGKTSRITLARGVYTDFGYYSDTGELHTKTYSDGTPTITYTYTRSGQADSVVDHTGTWDFVYDATKPWRHASTTLPSFYGTRYHTALYESGSGALLGRYKGFQLGSSVGNSADMEQVYTYSGNGRFDTLTTKRSSNSVTRTFDYSYQANTPFVSGLAITGGHDFTVTRGYESNRNILASIDSKWGATTVTRYDYAHNALLQRTTAKQSGSAFSDYYATGYSAVFNHYVYNARGELQTAAMYRGDTPSTTPSVNDELPGRRFEYRFDSIGNRKTAGPTGDANGVDDQYTTNALNQYEWKENNTVRVLGTAATGATVGVTGAYTTGKIDRAWGADLVPANASNAVAGTANVYSAVAGGGSGGGDLIRSENKAYFIPKGAQTFGYDADGNLTHDSVWDYTYDAENQLISMQHRAEVIGSLMITSANARRLVFKYDHMGRRVRKTTYGGWNGTTYSGTALTDTKFLYDGWNLIAEFDALSTLTLTRTFTWGLDLTGSLTDSGGVGALLQIHDPVAGKTLLPTYDGNGNVAALLNAETGALTLEAAYEYDPFGNLLRNEGPYSMSNNFRFSTKFTDTDSGLVYYGLRYYSPTLGRFINRDPIEEQGGLNLYGFCGNNGVNRWDYLGMEWDVVYNDDGTITASENFADDAGDNWQHHTFNSQAELDAFLGFASVFLSNSGIEMFEEVGQARGMGALLGQLNSIAGMSGDQFLDSRYGTPDPVTFFPGPSDLSYLESASGGSVYMAPLVDADSKKVIAGAVGAPRARDRVTFGWESDSEQGPLSRVFFGEQGRFVVRDESGNVRDQSDLRPRFIGGSVPFGPGGAAKLSGGALRVLGKLSGMADDTVAAAIRARGGSAANIARLETGMGQRTLAEVAEAAARGDPAAVQAIKMVKQAATKGQRY